jgi:tetratricopeptide (TPR) repeat protein
MNMWFNHHVLGPRGNMNAFARFSRTALTITRFGLLLLPFVAGISAAARGEELSAPAAAETALTEDEDSLLVSSRDSVEAIDEGESAAPTDADTGEADAAESGAGAASSDSLEPISQLSEHTPELAENESDAEDDSKQDDGDSSQFADALAKVAKPSQPKPAEKKAVGRTGRNPTEKVEHKPVKFQGITVGTSTKSELIAAWGEPAESADTDEGSVLSYEIEPFDAVDVLIDADDAVAAIKVTLAEALEAAALAEQLSLKEFEPVTVHDDNGQPLGQAFPERGVLFMFEEPEGDSLSFEGTEPTRVSHVAIQPLDARAFALRAEAHLGGPFQPCIDDLNTAIAIDPQDAHAHWLLAGIHFMTGQADAAVAASTAACDLEPNNAAYQLRRGQTLALLGEYDEAVHAVRGVLDRHDIEPIVRAHALHEMARLASLGDVQIASKAIPFDTRAIEIADRIATSKDEVARRAAKQLLVEAHMAVGEEIARQAFNQKVESLSLWIGRASGLAEEYITKDGGSVELRLTIAQRALAALASFKPTLDPAPWVSEAEEAANELLALSDEQLWQHHVKWHLGVAYLHALRVEHMRREATSALRYGQLAVENLAEGAQTRQAVHSSEQLVAQLYFHMGAVHAVLKQDHLKAMPWYEKAVPLLTGPRPVSELYSPRREGEMLVSIGVTCWQVGQQARALEVTRSGVNLVELAVEDGILAKTALAVPYGNLATMYDQMGESTNATKYMELAKSVNAPGGKGTKPAATSTALRPNGRAAVQANAQQAGPIHPIR